MRVFIKRTLYQCFRKKYPNKLLPKPNFKFIDNIDELLQSHFIRYFPVNGKIPIVDGQDKIDIKLISSPREQIIDLSTSLLGIFTSKDFIFRINRNGIQKGFIEYWDFESTPQTPKYKEDFNHKFNYGCWSLNPIDVENKSFTFQLNHPGQKSTTHQVTCNLIHTPTFSNYWHFSVRWFLDDEDVYELSKNGEISKGQVSRLSKIARLFLKEYVSLEIPKTRAINKSLYLEG
ncbi:hypothetical protein GO009_12135 [Muricauda sp. TY007]|uniref:hypothetical protein n=1 Tax=Allomuricauda sp. TY007 TaxID=2683200 RepID=UPI0013C2965C|nr:hypothetical protein [Muricauda sp. TY007]NDV16776.1 hypothetical protein [Muricauda sp. TY007]